VATAPRPILCAAGDVMTFEEWWSSIPIWRKNYDCCETWANMDKVKTIAKSAWEAGYTKSSYDALENVKIMNKKLFKGEEE